MRKLRHAITKLAAGESAAVAPEYALLIAVVALAAIFGVLALVEGITGFYAGLADLLNPAP
jgi:Flp pilus assembly pilin Flp